MDALWANNWEGYQILFLKFKIQGAWFDLIRYQRAQKNWTLMTNSTLNDASLFRWARAQSCLDGYKHDKKTNLGRLKK